MVLRTFELGDFPLQKGGAVLPDARLGYLTLGELSPSKDNVVLCPTWFTATPADTAAWMTGPVVHLTPVAGSSSCRITSARASPPPRATPRRRSTEADFRM